MQAIKNFNKKFRKEINHVQRTQGASYSESLKRAVAKLCRLKGISRKEISRQIGIGYTSVRMFDMKYNMGLKRNFEPIVSHPDDKKDLVKKSEFVQAPKIDKKLAKEIERFEKMLAKLKSQAAS